MTQLQITDQEFEQLLNFRDDMDKAIVQARQNGSPYMASVFQEVLKVATQKIQQVQGAKNRVMLAEHNKSIKQMRLQQRQAEQAAKQQSTPPGA